MSANAPIPALYRLFPPGSGAGKVLRQDRVTSVTPVCFCRLRPEVAGLVNAGRLTLNGGGHQT